MKTEPGTPELWVSFAQRPENSLACEQARDRIQTIAAACGQGDYRESWVAATLADAFEIPDPELPLTRDQLREWDFKRRVAATREGILHWLATEIDLSKQGGIKRYFDAYGTTLADVGMTEEDKNEITRYAYWRRRVQQERAIRDTKSHAGPSPGPGDTMDVVVNAA